MPRDIPIGNGRLLINFDRRYQIRDIYFPHVGQENHGGAGPCRFGLWSDVPGRNRNRLAWTCEEGWSIRQRYLRDTLTTSVSLDHKDMRLSMYCNDTVDFHRPVMVRKIKIKNLAGHERLVKVMHHQDLNMLGTKTGDTAYFDPELHAIIHYRNQRYLMVSYFGGPPPQPSPGVPEEGGRCGSAGAPPSRPSPQPSPGVPEEGERCGSAGAPPSRPSPQPSPGVLGEGKVASPSHGMEQRIDEYATGLSGFQGAEGTWRDAEDGHLQGNPIAQGSVDSTICHHVHLPPDGERTIYMVVIAGESREDLFEQHQWLLKCGPQTVIDRTTSYWRLWVGGTNINFGNLPPKVVELFKRSLLVVRTQIDNGGAILAANDSDIMQFSRDTYSYMWPRDGALVADALDLAGFPDVARWFFMFCKDAITDEGYFHHKYNPDGSPASSWHPWVRDGKRVLPIQEDETALVIWSLWRHYFRYRDIEFVRPMWVDLVIKAADFMVAYRDPKTGLPLPSYDLWEERWGVHAFTVATVYGGLKAARNFAVCFGDREKAEIYNRAAEEIRVAAAKYMYSAKLNRFVRRIVRISPSPLEGEGGAPSGATGEGRSEEAEPQFEIDEVVDASLFALYKFHLFEPDDPRVESTMRAVEEKLWIKTPVGGVARYENDTYHRISKDSTVPGNPWFICTLWLADYIVTRAGTLADLKEALPILQWTANHALDSGILAEQVNPYTNEPLSVSPLTWSHATVVSVAIKYLERLEQLQRCTSCHQPMFHLRRHGNTEVGAHVQFDSLEASFDTVEGREMVAASGNLLTEDPRTGQRVKLSLSIDVRDCIGCEVCVAHCDRGVLKMVDGKALVDLRHLNKCDMDGQCVEVCPTKVVTLAVQNVEETKVA